MGMISRVSIRERQALDSVLRLINTVSYRADALMRFPSRCPGLAGGPGPLAREGVPSATLATLRPLAAGSARRDFLLAPQAASSTPPHRLGSPVAGAAAAGGGAPGGRPPGGRC